MTDIQLQDCTDIETAKEFLNENFGKDWFRKIDIDTLDMGHNKKCVIGQLFSRVGTIDDFCRLEYGNSGIYHSTMFASRMVGIRNLTALWKSTIIQLRGETASLASESKVATEEKAFLLTFDDGSSMVVDHIKEAPRGVKFKIKEI